MENLTIYAADVAKGKSYTTPIVLLESSVSGPGTGTLDSKTQESVPVRNSVNRGKQFCQLGRTVPLKLYALVIRPAILFLGSDELFGLILLLAPIYMVQALVFVLAALLPKRHNAGWKFVVDNLPESTIDYDFMLNEAFL